MNCRIWEVKKKAPGWWDRGLECSVGQLGLLATQGYDSLSPISVSYRTLLQAGREGRLPAPGWRPFRDVALSRYAPVPSEELSAKRNGNSHVRYAAGNGSAAWPALGEAQKTRARKQLRNYARN
jgi:hypothetical protein